MPVLPPPVENNPGNGSELTISFTRGDEQWQEILDMPELLGKVLEEEERRYTLQDGWLLLDSGLALLPQFLYFNLNDNGTVETSTTIEIRDTRGLFSGVFEYQHARSDVSAAASLSTGFRRWMQVDLVVLEDALKAKPDQCSMMQMSFNGAEEGHQRPRRILLGPVEHYATIASQEAEEHPFCPCCLFSNSMKGFMPQLQSGGFYAVRMYAARNSEGEIMADCRVNGEDWDAGREALLQYVQQWSEKGLEYRKQMIVIQEDKL